MFKKMSWILILVAAIGGCSKRNKDQSLVVFQGQMSDDVKTWDPANAYDEASSLLVSNIYETLYQYAYLSESYQLEPLLAAAMPTFSDDKRTLTIPIKRGLHFHDDPCFKQNKGKGRELTAQDFIYQLKRLALPSLHSTGWWILDDKVVGINAFHESLLKTEKKDLPRVFAEEVEGLKAVDNFTLQIKLTKKEPSFLYLLAMSFAAAVPWEALEAYGDAQGNLLDHPVGTGPFSLTYWKRGHEILLSRYLGFRRELYPSEGSESFRSLGMLEDAGRPLPFLDQIHVTLMKESQPAWFNFMQGHLDVLTLPKDNFREAITNQVNLAPEWVKKGVHLSIEAGTAIRFISFNMKDSLLGKNKYLRQALSSAIDRDKWSGIFTNGTGKKMVNLIPPGIADRPRTRVMKYDFHLGRARALLKKAGFPNGEGLPLLHFDLSGASTHARQIGDFVSQQFGQIGVKIEVIENTFPAYLEKLRNGNLQIFYGGWVMDYPDALNIFQIFYGPNEAPGPGEFNYANRVFDRLFEKASSLDVGAERASLLQKMDDMIQEDSPLILGYYESSFDLSQPWFMNYRNSLIITNKYKYYRVNQEIKHRYLERQ